MFVSDILLLAHPLQPAFTLIAENPLIFFIGALVIVVGFSWYWNNRLALKKNLQGIPFKPLKTVLGNFYRIAFKEDVYPVFRRPEKFAEKPIVQKFTWRLWSKVLLFLTVFHIVVPFAALPHSVYGYPVFSVVILFWWYRLAKHVQGVVGYRDSTITQMFEVAASEMRYAKGTELSPWSWVRVQEWENLYFPLETHIAYETSFRSEVQMNQKRFEAAFNAVVSDQNIWTYEWEPANNRVIAKPVPNLPESAPYPFPDGKPWDEIPLGVGLGGKEVMWNVSSFPHALIAGSTGSGKSVTQRTILLHMLQNPKSRWRVVLCDPKRVELSSYRAAENVVKIATELEDMVDSIRDVEDEMQNRYRTMNNEGVNHFLLLEEPPPALLLMVDETYALLAPSGVKSEEGKLEDALKAEATGLIGNIARLGRAAGVHMILATQRPDAKVIPGEVRANLDCRIAQGRMDTTPSQMVLDDTAATLIPPVKGRAIRRAGNEFDEFQAYFVPNEDLEKAIVVCNALALEHITPEDLLGPPEGEEGEEDDTDEGSFLSSFLARVKGFFRKEKHDSEHDAEGTHEGYSDTEDDGSGNGSGTESYYDEEEGEVSPVAAKLDNLSETVKGFVSKLMFWKKDNSSDYEGPPNRTRKKSRKSEPSRSQESSNYDNDYYNDDDDDEGYFDDYDDYDDDEEYDRVDNPRMERGNGSGVDHTERYQGTQGSPYDEGEYDESENDEDDEEYYGEDELEKLLEQIKLEEQSDDEHDTSNNENYDEHDDYDSYEDVTENEHEYRGGNEETYNEAYNPNSYEGANAGNFSGDSEGGYEEAGGYSDEDYYDNEEEDSEEDPLVFTVSLDLPDLTTLNSLPFVSDVIIRYAIENKALPFSELITMLDQEMNSLDALEEQLMKGGTSITDIKPASAPVTPPMLDREPVDLPEFTKKRKTTKSTSAEQPPTRTETGQGYETFESSEEGNDDFFLDWSFDEDEPSNASTVTKNEESFNWWEI